MKIEVCIPAYNEAPIIAESVRVVRSALPVAPGVEWRLVVADNASTDGTGDVVRNLHLPDVSVLSIPTRGKGAAVVAAARASSADIFGFIDADLSADPACIRDLVDAVVRGSDIAVGSRLLPGAQVEREKSRTLSSRIFALLRRAIVGVAVADTQCGLKCTNRRGLEALAACVESGWFFDVEWLARAERSGLRIREVPIVWHEYYFPGRTSKLRVIRDGFGALAAFVRIRRRLAKQ